MTVSNSDIAAVLKFIHRQGDNFIRVLTIEDNGDPREPIDLTGHTVMFQMTSNKTDEVTLSVNTEDNPTNISITGTDHNKISINIPITQEVGKYHYKLSVTDASQNVRTWLRGEFIVNNC